MWNVIQAATGLLGMMSKNPTSRHAGMHIFRHALNHFLLRKR